MKVCPVGAADWSYVRSIQLRRFSRLRLLQGTSRSLLVLRLRHRNRHLNNSFPYVKVSDNVATARGWRATTLELHQLGQDRVLEATDGLALAGTQLSPSSAEVVNLLA